MEFEKKLWRQKTPATHYFWHFVSKEQWSTVSGEAKGLKLQMLKIEAQNYLTIYTSFLGTNKFALLRKQHRNLLKFH